MNDPFPVPMLQRRSLKMDEHDWQQLACAYDTWNEHAIVSYHIDEDLKSFVRDVFSSYGLWDDMLDEPMLGQYRTMFNHRC